MSSAAIGPPMVQAKSLHCPSCGGPVTLRGFGHTLSVVCPQCHAVLDVSNPLVKILQQAQQAQERVQPKVPLGTRGKIDNVVWEVIGFQVRQIEVDGVPYSWDEYLLFNPYHGFRYLSEYQGHWNVIRTLPLVPEQVPSIRPRLRVKGQIFRHFQHCEATTVFVLGEFPWRAHKGETATVDDFIAPPQMISGERMDGEVVWSLGDYWTGAQIWQAFQLQGRAPAAVGVFENQPSPHHVRAGAMWKTFLWMLVALAAMMFYFTVSARRQEVYSQHYTFSTAAGGEPSFVTPVFELKGRPSNVQLAIKTDLDNNWAHFNLALIDQDTGRAWDFGREVSYYHGIEDGESWTEGSSSDSVTIPLVPSGHYYLRIEPEMDTKQPSSMGYDVTLRRDVPTYWFFLIAFVLLLIPPIVSTARIGAFETARWRESDYGSGGK